MQNRNCVAIIGCLVLAVALLFPSPGFAQTDSDSIERIAPESAREKVDSGEALLVCAYDDQRCREIRIEGAITLSALDPVRNSIGKDKELIFYCGSPDEATSAGLAAMYKDLGFPNVKALKGGYRAWMDADYMPRNPGPDIHSRPDAI